MSDIKLFKASYYDKDEAIRLECYADIVALANNGKYSYIAVIRLSGYPEMVKGIGDAIYGGGSISIEVDDVEHTFRSYVKQYHRDYSHDGPYAEAVLRIKDEEHLQAAPGDDNAGESDTHDANAPRKCYIFCEAGDSEQLFEEIDKKTCVPLIPGFQDYILSEFQRRGILSKLKIFSTHEKFDAWCLQMSPGEKNIIDVVNDGIKSGAIYIPGTSAADHDGAPRFPAVYTVTQYLNTFGINIAERIKGQFNPIFDPSTEALSPEVLAVNDYIRAKAGYSLYNAQLAVVEAHKRCLERGKITLCIAECGSGKSKIGTSALHAYQQRLSFRQPGPHSHAKHFNVVLCPSHMAKKWVREIEETLPNTFAIIVTSITELNLVYSMYEQDNKSCYVIITKEKSRDGYQRRPAIIWSKHRKEFICPDCNKTLMMEIIKSDGKYKVPADSFWFYKETMRNHKCGECGSLLWTALAPERQSDWVKVSKFGFIFRRDAHKHLQYVTKKPKVYDAIEAIANNPNGTFPNTGAYRRFPLSTYIKYHMRGKVDGLIVDELHNYNNDSGQGDAMGELFQAAKKVVGMTATLINGYASGIFHLLYRISPSLMLRDNKSYDSPADFNMEYGVTESVYETDESDYNANRRAVTRKTRERQLPGVSPLVYSRFLMESAAFLSLMDMGKNLPEYEEIPIQLEMNSEVSTEYHRIEGKFIKILRENRDIATKILSVYLNLLTVYPDQPYGHDPVKHPVSGDDIIIPNDTSSINELHEKDQHVLEIVRRKVEDNERVLIYTSWTRIDTREKLTKLLMEQGYRVAILTSTVPPKKREEWVEQQVQNGIQVLICNPSLVETGLDLNDFTTLVYYNVSYNLFTLRQSSRRSWRINQRAHRIEVYFLYYAGTMQHRAIRLMASKLAVAGVIEGNLTDEGLAAMSDCQDMTTALARELTSGIKDEVEDLGDLFKRMAMLKSPDDETQTTDIIEGTAAYIDDTDAIGDSTHENAGNPIMSENITPAVKAPKAPMYDTNPLRAKGPSAPRPPKLPGQQTKSGLLALLHETKPIKLPKKKAIPICDSQMSLLDFIEDIPA